MKKLFSIKFVLAFLICCSGCGYKKENTIKIGILQLVEHEALDECRKGFIEGLSDQGYISGLNTDIDYQNAQGEQSNCSIIASKFVSDRKNLVFAIATPAAQSMANATKKIPVLVGAVTDFVSSGLVNSNENPGGNVTGVSDLAPIKEQIEFIVELLPSAKHLGIFYCSNEINSKYQADMAFREAKNIGLEPEIYTVSQSSDIKLTIESIVNKVDVIYTPTDSMVASSIDTILSVSNSRNVPVICGEGNLVSKGSIGTYGIDYYELGKMAAFKAVKIIKDGIYPGSMPVDFLKGTDLILNSSVANKLNIKIPERLINEAKIIIN